jgi:hypothetical protein
MATPNYAILCCFARYANNRTAQNKIQLSLSSLYISIFVFKPLFYALLSPCFFFPFPFILPPNFPTVRNNFPNPKLHPLILTLQTKKYTSAQLLMQNAKKMPKLRHLSLALILSVDR